MKNKAIVEQENITFLTLAGWAMAFVLTGAWLVGMFMLTDYPGARPGPVVSKYSEYVTQDQLESVRRDVERLRLRVTELEQGAE